MTGFSAPYLSHEIDLLPNRDRILATLDHEQHRNDTEFDEEVDRLDKIIETLKKSITRVTGYLDATTHSETYTDLAEVRRILTAAVETAELDGED